MMIVIIKQARVRNYGNFIYDNLTSIPNKILVLLNCVVANFLKDKVISWTEEPSR